MREWFKARNIWGAAILSLSDAEAGRLAKALWAYTMTGEQQNLSGAEKGIFAMILMTLGQDEQADADISRKRALAGSMGGKQKQANASNGQQNKQMQANASNKNKNKEEEKEDVVVVNGDDDGPFGLTGADIHQSLLRDQQIETAARSIGLQTTEAGLMRGRRLAEQYGMDKLLDAISKAVDAPKWAYVEGILRNGGQHDGNRRNNQPNTGANNPYAFLHDDAV